ncbi:hypothetical protein DXN04_30795 [Chitinophaga silvisoli]|uniref:Uncharacterized protein n=1 Tax=Chitinophaga silvisoli TaxID=2291814 RepID=A0A3E1NSQ0_9BACT|nr:hypothetical protein DXN04_30795 [Chitinophaga silvisoli]
MIKNVIYPNIIAYYSPILQIYGNHTPLYSEWPSYYGEKVKNWFNLKRINNPDKCLQFRGAILSPSMLIFSRIPTFFLLSLVIMAIYVNFKTLDANINYCLIFLIGICIINFLFYIALSPSVIRYQFNIITIEFFIPIWLIDCIKDNPNTIK